MRLFTEPWPDLTGKSVLVTGGTGSFGNAFIKHCLENQSLRKLIIFSRDELKQSEMEQRFHPKDHPELRYFLGDVRDRNRLQMATRDVDIIVHAAALKQVPAAEYNPMECINTNVMGAENVVQAALANGVSKVIALSTDKAANPINLYGASKLASDKIFVAANNLSGSDETRFSVVRYGNVMGSRGSVLPIFRKMIAEGATSLPITDERMTRFWITLDQGVNFVLSSLAMMQGGEIFVPKIPSLKVTDMARYLAPGLAQHSIGLRPGEKLHEIMITEDDAANTWELDDRYIIAPVFHFWSAEANIQAGAKPAPDRFHFSSETNTEWMTEAEFNALVAEQAG
ncbi:MAG: UDP-N-acetylglucosamine 4,6-dehydratase (inverting) [Magnetovibrionaceae bacterium]